MYISVHGCVQMQLHVCVEARVQPRLPFFRLRQALSSCRELLCLCKLVGHQAPGISLFPLPRAGFEGYCHA